MNNGRVADINSQQMMAYSMNDYKRDLTFSKEATRGIVAKNEVSDLFFSDLNIDALQLGIRNGVYLKSCKKHVIGTQSEEELKIIMRSVYLQHAKNLPFDVVAQVRELNLHVLIFAVDRILTEINIYKKYRQDLASLPDPMERSTNTSSRGTKVLEITKF